MEVDAAIFWAIEGYGRCPMTVRLWARTQPFAGCLTPPIFPASSRHWIAVGENVAAPSDYSLVLAADATAVAGENANCVRRDGPRYFKSVG